MTDSCPRKYKIPSHQHGHGYLTTHRICYVDNTEPRVHSSAIDLKEVDRYEFYVSVCWKWKMSFLMIVIGWFLEIIGQDHPVPKVSQKAFELFIWSAWNRSLYKRIWDAPERFALFVAEK